MSHPQLLIIEDDEGIRTQLKYALRAEFAVWLAEDRTQALAIVRDIGPSVVTLDLGLPPRPESADEGLAALEEILDTAPSTKVIVLTGNGDRANALRAVQRGAFDYLAKPIDIAEFKVVLRRAAYLQAVEEENDQQSRARESAVVFDEILGTTPRLREIFSMITRVARTDATVLVEGESGTGKELVARAIHTNSTRKRGSFVPINCGAIPETLLESELFGHEKGAYTGAHVQRKGKIEVAEGGTLFLDEIGEMSLPLQVKLLRFLQEREIERVGGREPIKVDVRIIAATNKSLKAEIQGGRFREDLYYRLSVVIIDVPPLRERGEDIVLLANAFLRRSCTAHRRKIGFSPEALGALVAYPWPGNIRELENKIQRAVIMAAGKSIQPADLDLAPRVAPSERSSFKEARQRIEHQSVIDALLKHRGNIRRAAKEIEVSPPTFYSLLERHQINARDFKPTRRETASR
jgi:two-component system NtrC family response regulator